MWTRNLSVRVLVGVCAVAVLAAVAVGLLWRPRILSFLSVSPSYSNPTRGKIEDVADIALPAWNPQHSKPLSERLDKLAEHGAIRCRARVPVPRSDKSDTVEISLVNEGDQTLRIPYTIFGLKEHVTMCLRDRSGTVVADVYWATLSSTLVTIDPKTGEISGQRIRELQPGEEERHVVYPSVILHCHEGPKVPPGRYDFQVIFEYADLSARSERIPVEVRDEDVRVIAD